MDENIAYCGLDCGVCPIRLATLEHDEARKLSMRAEIAHKLTGVYKKGIDAKEITDCDGCKESGRLFNGCANCPIRMCAREKLLDNCALCDGFCCEKLERHYAFDPSSRGRLEEIRANLPPQP